ncbi:MULTISPECIES: GNAT family N-acetyltransferase [unclassified Planococcus (in: firmicutes)]|uniref:GNAT family N-acetyltransferase n=1 Tax=unclassified Planococcus (in: firmicutes) TaxID=2662419 RepID=UPI000C3443A8|nr:MULTISPECIES: GNAT family N-acetyltransferase [unclassified Planococcus (in: firmicutes)]AUD14993.1 N-acetyltransferase [Planococcus sp. MB-3u-03]PKG47068.1 N-acetyltransferase [Planococcus sp. Urea-trap-24]PKG87803.1 N-acetyltransferase [Planococcus sp. Urea-3u-39]PKH35461.1 N-acetyltransferase [Planococcus sp. MB-3u-09]
MKNGYLFESERLGFRRWKTSDHAPFAALNANPDVMEFFPKTLSRTESDALIERIEAHFEEKGYGLWAVERKEDGAFIGFIGLLDVNFDIGIEDATEIGWRLEKKFWKKGYATEGANACLAYAFEELGKREIYSFTSTVNTPSETVMKRIGMEKAGEFEHPRVPQGSPLRKHVLYKKELTQE